MLGWCTLQPKGSVMNTEEPVVVYTVNQWAHAELVKNFLESEGIPCSIGGDASLPGMEDIEILVRPNDAGRARGLLEEHEASRRAMADEEDFEADNEELSEE
jgi:hypothetical protein